MPLKRKSILIVDGDLFLAGLYARRFEAKRWGVRVAGSVAEAEALLARKAPNAIVVDAGAVEGGWEFLARLRSNPKTGGSAIVVLTALGNRDQIRRAEEIGVSGYLLKGHFVPSEVEEKIERLVAESQETG